MRYMIMVTNELSANNSLKKEMLEYIKTWNRTIIDDINLETIKNSALKICEVINTSNTRCKKLDIRWTERWGSNDRDITHALYCADLFTLTFYGERV
jgi:hypothetical protein